MSRPKNHQTFDFVEVKGGETMSSKLLEPNRLPMTLGLVTFSVLSVCALLFADKFKFLQSGESQPDSSGKCPQKCCKACSLNIPLVLVFSAGLGVVAAGVGFLVNKEHRDKLRENIYGATRSA